MNHCEIIHRVVSHRGRESSVSELSINKASTIGQMNSEPSRDASSFRESSIVNQ